MLRTALLLVLTTAIALVANANKLDTVRAPVSAARLPGPVALVASYSGWGTIGLADTGEWRISIYDADSAIVIDPLHETGNFPEYPVDLDGDIDVVQDGLTLHVAIVTELGEYYVAVLTVEEEPAAVLAAQLDSFVVDDYEQTTRVPADDPEIIQMTDESGGSCECVGKCSASCPAGKSAYCNCRGTGVCRCLIDPTK